MNKLILITLLFLTQFSQSQTADQWEIRKFNSGGGMTPRYISPENGKVLGANVSGNPVMITLPTGSFGALTGVPGDNAALQAALDLKQNADTDLTIWAGITPSANVQTLLGTFNKANSNAALTDDNFAFIGTDNAFSVAQTISTARIGSMNVTGVYPNLTNTAHFRNALMTGNNDSALLQDEIGNTIINASSGMSIFFSINGGFVGKVLPSGFNFDVGQGIGFNTLAPDVCGIRAEGSGDWFLKGVNMRFRSGDGSNREPLAINTASPGTVTLTGITEAERIISGSYQIGKDSATPQINFVGDSLTSGFGATSPYNTYLTIPTWQGMTFEQTNSGVAGYSFEDVVDNSHTALNPNYAHHAGLNIAVVWVGSNDLLPYTAQVVYSRCQEACRYLRRQGWRVIVVPVISRADAAFDVKKNAYNALLLAGWPAFADAIVTLSTNLTGDGQFNDLTYFNADKVHLNDTGQALVAAGVDATVDALIASTGNVNYTDGDKGSVTVSNAGQTISYDAASLDLATKVTGVLPSANGGTGVNNAGTLTNASNTTITGGGTLALAGFTLTVPETLTAAGRNVANTFSVAQTVGLTSLGATTAPGLSLTNSTAAAAGAQQAGPSWVIEGQGWKTTATAASQSVKFRGYVLPVQGAANPTGNFIIQSDINNTGSWTTNFQVTSGGTISTSAAGNTLSLGTDPTLTQGNSGRPMDLRATAGFINISDGTLPQIGFTTTNGNTNPDLRLARIAAGVLGLRGTSGTTGAAVQLEEQTAPAAGATNTVRIYAEDNGAGKTRLMALFPTGAAVQIAIEP